MGSRGPKPKAAAQLKLTGSWRAEERGKTELKVEGERPERPAWLSDEARKEWDRVVPALAALKILTKFDRSMLAAYCHAVGEYVGAAKALLKIESGEADEHTGNIVDHPRVVMNRAFERMVKVADRYGISTAARARLNPPGTGENEATKNAPQGKSRFFPGGPATRPA